MEHDNRFKSALPALQDICLSTEEKEEIRSALMLHIQENPRRESYLTSIMHIFMSRPLGLALVAVLVVLGTGSGALFASSRALPGDVLYPVKTSMNEPVVGFFKGLSLQDKVAFEWELVEKRLVEAEQLAEDVLTTERENIRQRVTEQRSRAENLARKLIESEASTGVVASVQSDIRMTSTATEPGANAPELSAQANVRIKGAPQIQQKKDTARNTKPTKLRKEPPAVAPLAPAAGEGEPQSSVAVSESATATTTATTVQASFAISLPEKEMMEAADVGRKVFDRLDDIYERHQDIIKKLDLPLPYVEATQPLSPEETPPAAVPAL